MLEDLDIAFLDNEMVDLKSYDTELLQGKLKKVRELRVKQIEKLAKLVEEIKIES